MNIVTTRWKYLPHISAKASIYVTKRPSCHVLPEKYRQVTTARCSAVHESRNYWRKTKMEERRRIERKPRWNRRRGRRRRRREDRRRENAAIVPCSRHFRNRTVRRRSQIDTTGKSTRNGFFFPENEISAGTRRRREKLLRR